MKAIGVTIKAVVKVDERLEHELLQTRRGDLMLGGVALGDLKIGLRQGMELEPARIWVQMEDVPHEGEDDFLEE
jgi:hypothetical protein